MKMVRFIYKVRKWIKKLFILSIKIMLRFFNGWVVSKDKNKPQIPSWVYF